MSRSKSQQMTDSILEMVKSQPQTGFRRAEIRRYLGHVDEEFFRSAFKSLVASGRLVKVRGGRYVSAESISLKQGVIHINAKGFGFVHFDDGTKDMFIPAEETLGAMSGDTVLVKLEDDEDSRGPSGVVKKVVSRGHEEFVACLGFGSEGYVVRPLRKELPVTMPVVADYGEDITGGAQEGDWVQARMVPGRHPNSPMCAKVVRRLSSGGSIVSVLNALVKEYGLPKKYSTVQEKQFSGIVPIEVQREDLTHLSAITVDPIDAKDFDDAVSLDAGSEPGMVVLGVHIADVACFVPRGSDLDKRARERGFTSYLPGRTIPMLPDVLSTGLCSLREGEEHAAHSVLMTMVAATGEIVSVRRVHSRICVSRRLTFGEVDRVISGDASGSGLPSETVSLVERLYGLSRVMREERRRHEMFLPLGIAEYHVLTGGRPIRVLGVERTPATPASEMIEELMLAANVSVGMELLNNGIPALFRNHGEPDPQAVTEYELLAAGVLGRKKVPSLSERGHLLRFFESLPAGAGSELLCMSFLRCLPRAEYGSQCSGHFGLGKPVYCHFTSPIRRYPDLVVHQQLLSFDLGEAVQPQTVMDELASQVNELETNVDQAGFAACDRMKLVYLERQRQDDAGRCYEAYVLRASHDHLSLYLPQFGLMGGMEVSRLGDERWHYDARTSALVSHTGQSFRCGNVIYVQVRGIDAIHGELDLRPVQMKL